MKKKPTTKGTPRDGPRTVNRKIKDPRVRRHTRRSDRRVRIGVANAMRDRAYMEGRKAGEDAERRRRENIAALAPQAERDALADRIHEFIPGIRPDLTGTEPQPWDCRCGLAHNSAIVEECPTCHALRPFDYTPPVAENAPFIPPVRKDWPQPHESPDDYARRMNEARGLELPDPALHAVPTWRRKAEYELSAEEIQAAKEWDIQVGGQGGLSTREEAARRVAAGESAGPMPPGYVSIVVPSPTPAVAADRPLPGYYCPIEFAGPVGSVSVDPALLQQLVDLTNTAAKTGAVRSVTLGVKSPQQARLVLRVDFDLGEAQIRTVSDE